MGFLEEEKDVKAASISLIQVSLGTLYISNQLSFKGTAKKMSEILVGIYWHIRQDFQ